MPQLHSSRRPGPLVPARQIREIFAASGREYGRDFDEAEWERVAERVSALVRLLWQIDRSMHGEGDRACRAKSSPTHC